MKSLVKYMGFLLNRFPSSNGVSEDESPAEIVLGVAKIDIGAKHIPWRVYAQAWKQTKNKKTNTMVERSVHVIAMHPSKKAGGF